MKKNLLIALVLMIVAALSGLAISGMNKLTAPIIEQNMIEKEENLCKKIFASYDGTKSTKTTEGFTDKAISKKIIAFDSSGKALGYIYTVSGKNSYGTISLLVGIDEALKLVSVEFLENGQSYSSEVEKHVNGSYQSGLDISGVGSIDTACGATYGAITVKKLVTIAFNDLKEEENPLKKIFASYDETKSTKITEGFTDKAISEKILAFDFAGKALGYIYTVSGKNSYGAISLLVGIDEDLKLVSVEFLENGQSYSSKVEKHVSETYQSGLDISGVGSIDTTCGATYGAITVKELVTTAFNDLKGGNR